MKKEKIITAISIFLMAVPWTLLILREYEWALKSPTAEILISGYAVFMILSGIFTIFFYQKKKIQNLLMKIGVLVNGLYAVTGVGVFLMMAVTRWG